MEEKHKCRFCGRVTSETMISSPKVKGRMIHICEQCVEICMSVILNHRYPRAVISVEEKKEIFGG